MQTNWVKDGQDSIKAFHAIEHTVIPKLITGRLLNIEQHQHEILLNMDVKSGIDLVRIDAIGLQGIAWRAQWCGNHAFNTFTIRSKRDSGTPTELAKRLEQIEKGYFYPAFTIQAYFDNKEHNNCISAAIIRTKDLYWHVLNKPDIFQKRRSNNEFLYAHWDSLAGYVKTYHSCEADKKHLDATKRIEPNQAQLTIF
jgi:hypothetical protein